MKRKNFGNKKSVQKSNAQGKNYFSDTPQTPYVR